MPGSGVCALGGVVGTEWYEFVADVSTAEAAAWYAKTKQWAVFPITDNGKEPYPGSHSHLDASNDPAHVIAAFNARGESNVAIATGERSGVLVLDVDDDGAEHVGLSTLAQLEKLYGALPETLMAATPRGGTHYYFRYPESGRWGNTAGRVGRDIDTRGEGGYAVLAPSEINGTAYRWLNGNEPAELPEWLLGLLAARSYEHEQQEADWDRSDDEVSRYVRAVVTDESSELARVTEGSRNDRLNRSAFVLGTIGAHNALTEDYARTALLAACETNGLLQSSGIAACILTFSSGWTAGMRSPRAPWPPPPMNGTEGLDFGPAPGTRESEGSGRPDPDAFFDKNGLLAEDLAREVFSIGPLRVGEDMDFWSYHEGVWSHDKHAVHARVARLLRNRYRNAHAENVAAMLRHRVKRIECGPISQYINCQSGMIEWATGEVVPHDDTYVSTVQLPWDFDPDAKCPEFETFLSQVVAPDMIDLMWEFIGYMMYSGNPLQIAFMLVGKGGNGKGTLLRVISALLGKGNTSAVTLDSLSSNRFAAASLYGKLANIAGDIDATYQESTAMFKKITGEDDVDAERKFGHAFTFRPWATPVFSANRIPGSADTTEGYTRRWVILPFPFTFSDDQKDPHLTERLVSEVPGIAAKALPALRALMLRGHFELPTSAREAKEDFERRIDQVRSWIAECCVADQYSRENRTVCYRSYKLWAQENGHRALRSSEFYDRVQAAGFRLKIIKGQRYVEGLTVQVGRAYGNPMDFDPSYSPDND
jgi:putative DNA primase/helicase